ncbi:MAG: enoyl-CoA hydratase-related protein [Acidimicrobiales bacterium]
MTDADEPHAAPGATAGRPLARHERRGPVATFTLDSPRNRNALSARLLGELFAGLQEVQADPDVRVVVLTGEGSVFCSGLDLDERLHPPATPGSATLAEVLSSLHALPQPVVARVNGHVRAGGMGLVAACDLAVAPERATFAFTEVRVGVAPAIIAVPALALMGRRAFARYALTGDVFDADEAVAAGLLSAAAPDTAAMDEWVTSVVAALLRSAPSAVAATKELPGLVGGQPWDEAMTVAESLSAELFAAPAGTEGMAAFLEKRAPAWTVAWPPEDAARPRGG